MGQTLYHQLLADSHVQSRHPCDGGGLETFGLEMARIRSAKRATNVAPSV